MRSLFVQGYLEDDGQDTGESFFARITQLGSEHITLRLEDGDSLQEDITLRIAYEEPFSVLFMQAMQLRPLGWPTKYCTWCGAPLLQGATCPGCSEDERRWERVRDDFADQVARYKAERRAKLEAQRNG